MPKMLRRSAIRSWKSPQRGCDPVCERERQQRRRKGERAVHAQPESSEHEGKRALLCYDVQTYEQLRQNGHWDTCNVLFAASTMELGPADFPVVAVEDIITQRGLDKIKSGLSGYLTEEEFEHFKQNLVNQFSLENVVESLTILNASRVLSLVADMLEEMQRALGSHFQPKTVVGLNLHISCLIERLVKKRKSRATVSWNASVKSTGTLWHWRGAALPTLRSSTASTCRTVRSAIFTIIFPTITAMKVLGKMSFEPMGGNSNGLQ